MKQDNVLILLGVVALLLSVLFAFDDHLSEAAPVLMVLGLGFFAWLIYRRTWKSAAEKPLVPASASWSSICKASSILGIAGLICVGLSGLSLLDSSLEEFAAAGIVGGILFVFAVLARIVQGMLVRRVDATTGGLSIAVIVGLVWVIAALSILIYVVFLILSGLGLF